MTEHITEAQPVYDRREALRLAAAVLGGLVVEGCGGSSTEQTYGFENSSSWEQDFTRMPDGPIGVRVWNIAENARTAMPNQQEQVYTSSTRNVRIESGRLVLEAHHEHDSGPLYTSGRIDTQGKHPFLYGKVEVDARLPHGVGTWAAIWALPDHNRYTRSDASANQNYLLGGEMDIMEYVGMDSGAIYTSTHTYADDVQRKVPRTRKAQVADCEQQFHTYGLEWTPASITYTIDGRPVSTMQKQGKDAEQWPFDQPAYLILNLAMGGTWGGQRHDEFPPTGIDDSQAPWRFETKAIRYYALEQKS